jgi:hypothetical protein
VVSELTFRLTGRQEENVISGRACAIPSISDVMYLITPLVKRPQDDGRPASREAAVVVAIDMRVSFQAITTGMRLVNCL